MNKVSFDGKNISEIVDFLQSKHIDTGVSAASQLSVVVDGERKTIFKGDSVVFDDNGFRILTMGM